MVEMIALLILLISAGSMKILSNRLKVIPGLGGVPRTVTGPMMHTLHQGPLLHHIARLPRLQMQQLAEPEDEDHDDGDERDDEITPDETPSGSGADVETWGWKAKSRMDGRSPISEQKFPPHVIYSVDARLLLYTWADSWVKPLTVEVLNDDEENDAAADKRQVLGRMRLVVEAATDIFMQIQDSSLLGDLEMVGLVPKEYEIPFDEEGSDEKSLLALGLFSREEVQDDSKGSLRKKLEEHYGKQFGTWAGNAEKPLEAFAIEGIADAPDLDDRQARILLSKIAKYAQKEQRMVVVPLRTVIRKDDGMDFSKYYVRLGFEKVELEGKKYKLVYTGSSISEADEWVEKQQICAGLNLWQGA